MSVQPNNKITHITRLRPEFSIDNAGNVDWLASLVDHNSDLFYRGKTVTNSEFNELFIKHAAQSNYTADSFKEFLGVHLPTVLKRQVSSAFNLRDSFIKFITVSDWGIQEGDGYYYINISAAEHGYVPVTQGNVLDRVNIEAEFYALDTNNNFYRLDQVEISTDNDVILYTDDSSVVGFLVVKTNDKAVAYSGTKIDASMTTGFATVATTGLYSDLIGLDAQGGPNARLTDLENLTESFINGDTSVAKAEQAVDATNLTGTIRNISLDTIFESGSATVKNATASVIASAVTDTIGGLNLKSIFEVPQDSFQITPTVRKANAALYAIDSMGNIAGKTTDTRLTFLEDTHISKFEFNKNARDSATAFGNNSIAFGGDYDYPGLYSITATDLTGTSPLSFLISIEDKSKVAVGPGTPYIDYTLYAQYIPSEYKIYIMHGTQHEPHTHIKITGLRRLVRYPN